MHYQMELKNIKEKILHDIHTLWLEITQKNLKRLIVYYINQCVDRLMID